MIKFKRGKTTTWKKRTVPLADGQPGYDKEKHRLKIGDGQHLWSELPNVGLSAEDILKEEAKAKEDYAKDKEDRAIFTYGSENPDEDTVGRVYLQHYDSEPEVDYIVSYGVDGIWTYQKWHSGIVKCWGNLDVDKSIQSVFEESKLYYSEATSKVSYPVKFSTTPSETATIRSTGNLVWLASKNNNTVSESATYTIISPDKQSNAKYKIMLQVYGFCK